MHGTEIQDEALLEPEEHEIMPVPVHGEIHIAGRVCTSEEAADFGTYRTVVLVGTEDKQQILSQDNHRVRAVVSCTGTGPVYLGTESQCANVKAGNTVAGGYLLATGMFLELRNKETLWLIGDGTHSATISILQEKMR